MKNTNQVSVEKENKSLSDSTANEKRKEILKQWCEITTCAGFVDFSLARHKCGKVFWLILIFVSLCVTCWQTGKIFDDFINGKPFTTYITVISDEPIYFPNVTVCNQNRINKIRGGHLSKNGLIYAFFSVLQDYFSSYNYSTWFPELNSYEKDYIEMMESNNLTGLRDIFHQFGYSCQETFLACVWGAESFDCCQHATETITVNGRCWNILYKHSNGKERLEQNFPGSFYGLKLLMNPNVETYREDIAINSFLSKGVMIKADYQQTLGLADYFSLSPGTRAHLELSTNVNRFEFSDVSLHESPCVTNGIIIHNDVEYSLANCINECWSIQIFNASQCVRLEPAPSRYETCSPQQFTRQLQSNKLS